MKLFAVVLIAASACFAGDLRGRFQTSTLDIQTDSSVNQSPDLPGLGQIDHVVSVSIISTDYSAQAYCVRGLVLLSDGETGGVNTCVDRNPTDGPVSVQFSTGSKRPIRWLRLSVVRMKAEPADIVVNTARW